ncbi:SGNH hydrolase-type esterase domain-containing protein [Syncephalastrum racemosum]|uniref:SGNH hydrolase-type esterase domain-containing protein n=1 Tax=Syncephalastrum racemosum TaxID=13706 RepID=A0A1X2H3P6_SYNRA|nr:SGNH hydrolase-type esterase domain-containing protein [Syncephalastrum racemosum]
MVLRLTSILLLLCLALRVQAQQQQNKTNSFVVFGDSYTTESDKFCNGPRWVDQLMQTWDNTSLTNNAVGGAMCNDPSQDKSVYHQLENYLQTSPQNDPGTTIYSFFVGINDLVHNIDSSAVLSCIAESIGRIHEKLQGKHFLVFNMVPFERSPHITLNASSVPYATAWVKQYNDNISRTMTNLTQSQPDLDIHIVDTYATVSNVLDHPTDYGITESVQSAWFLQNGHPDPKTELAEGNKYFWYDITHMTNVVHTQMKNGVLAMPRLSAHTQPSSWFPLS